MLQLELGRSNTYSPSKPTERPLQMPDTNTLASTQPTNPPFQHTCPPTCFSQQQTYNNMHATVPMQLAEPKTPTRPPSYSTSQIAIPPPTPYPAWAHSSTRLGRPELGQAKTEYWQHHIAHPLNTTCIKPIRTTTIILHLEAVQYTTYSPS